MVLCEVLFSSAFVRSSSREFLEAPLGYSLSCTRCSILGKLVAWLMKLS